MTQVRFVMTIARKPQDVFDLVADITRNTEWAPGFTYAEKVTPGPVSLGSAFNTSAKGLGPMQIEIVEYERPTRLGFVGRARPVVMHHHFTLTPDDRGTRADQRIDVRPKRPTAADVAAHGGDAQADDSAQHRRPKEIPGEGGGLVPRK